MINKTTIANEVAEKLDLPLMRGREAASAVFDAITAELAKGNAVNIYGYGTFSPRHRPEREGWNPRTQEKMQIAASTKVSFRPAKALKAALNPKTQRKVGPDRGRIEAQRRQA